MQRKGKENEMAQLSRKIDVQSKHSGIKSKPIG